jgi:hypothetical protein
VPLRDATTNENGGCTREVRNAWIHCRFGCWCPSSYSVRVPVKRSPEFDFSLKEESAASRNQLPKKRRTIIGEVRFYRVHGYSNGTGYKKVPRPKVPLS